MNLTLYGREASDDHARSVHREFPFFYSGVLVRRDYPHLFKKGPVWVRGDLAVVRAIRRSG